jgi:acyl dehydratase
VTGRADRSGLDELADRCGEVLGVTGPFTVSQLEEDAFAALIGDWDPMHNDPAWQLDPAWSGPIVLGFHVLARAESFLRACGLPAPGRPDGVFVTTGLDRVRFTSPLPVGAEVRAEVALEAVERLGTHALVRTRHQTRVAAAERPTMVAEHLGAFMNAGQYPEILAAISGKPPLIADIPPGSRIATSAVHDERFYEGVAARAGDWLGSTPWTTISDREADAFAVLAGGTPSDRHRRPAPGDPAVRGLVDPLHLLALRAYFMPFVGLPVLSDERMAAFNYGIDRARWYDAVPIGCELRDHVQLQEVRVKDPGRYLVSTRHIVEARGHDHAFLAADCLTLFVVTAGEPETS